MKKMNYYLSLAAAALMAAATVSCTYNDNPAPTPEPEPEYDTTGENLIIKEINVGGCKTDANKAYVWSKAITLYNNSAAKAEIKNVGIGILLPLNANATNNNYGEDGILTYEKEGWIPAGQGLWYFPETLTIEPYSDVVIAVNGAIDHINHPVVTSTTPEGTIISASMDLTNADYAMYDPESQYINASAYPAPANAAIKTMKAAVFASANAWPVSVSSPALFLFKAPDDVDLPAYLSNEENILTVGGTAKSNLSCKIPMAWVIDGVELYQTTNVEKSKKRLPAVIDSGYGLYNNGAGYSAYRNVNKEATEAIAENAGKLVYDYADAIEGTADASGIDAAASIKNGAKIVYIDTNNSTNDFHLRKAWSLK